MQDYAELESMLIFKSLRPSSTGFIAQEIFTEVLLIWRKFMWQLPSTQRTGRREVWFHTPLPGTA